MSMQDSLLEQLAYGQVSYVPVMKYQPSLIAFISQLF
jgi:hypothetical protein